MCGGPETCWPVGAVVMHMERSRCGLWQPENPTALRDSAHRGKTWPSSAQPPGVCAVDWPMPTATHILAPHKAACVCTLHCQLSHMPWRGCLLVSALPSQTRATSPPKHRILPFHPPLVCLWHRFQALSLGDWWVACTCIPIPGHRATFCVWNGACLLIVL